MRFHTVCDVPGFGGLIVRDLFGKPDARVDFFRCIAGAQLIAVPGVRGPASASGKNFIVNRSLNHKPGQIGHAARDANLL